MIFNTRPLKTEHYDDILVGWWKDWGFEAPSREFLPNDGTGGLIIWDGDTPVAAGFLYNTNSKIGWINWIVSNKEYKHRENRKAAIGYLIDSLKSVAISMGKKYIFANNNNPFLINHFLSKGFHVGAKNQTELLLKI